MPAHSVTTNIANLTGFPDLIVPAGFTGDDPPVALSFFGPAFSEAKLLALGYSFEQATHARRMPVHAPALPGEQLTVKSVQATTSLQGMGHTDHLGSVGFG